MALPTITLAITHTSSPMAMHPRLRHRATHMHRLTPTSTIQMHRGLILTQRLLRRHTVELHRHRTMVLLLAASSPRLMVPLLRNVRRDAHTMTVTGTITRKLQQLWSLSTTMPRAVCPHLLLRRTRHLALTLTPLLRRMERTSMHRGTLRSLMVGLTSAVILLPIPPACLAAESTLLDTLLTTPT